MSYVGAIQVLKAAADPTRFRLLSMLTAGEATVGELQAVLQQSQPRVSRHLKLLGQAGLVENFRDGQWMYYRIDDQTRTADPLSALLDLAGDDPEIERDRRRLERLKRERESEALRPTTAGPWVAARLTEHRPDSRALSAAVDEYVADQQFVDGLLIGCGSGALINCIAPHARQLIAIDDSKNSRLIARSRVHQSAYAHLSIRNARPTAIPYEENQFDLVVLNEALGSGNQTREILAEAARVADKDGRLLIFDRIQPIASQLPMKPNRNALVENQLSTGLREAGFKIVHRHWFPGRVMEYALFSAVPNNTG